MKMNRRTSIRGIAAFVALGGASFTIFKWKSLNAAADVSYIHKKKHIIAELADTIIPRTDTPGAKDASVEDFIIGMIEFCSDNKTQNNFMHGLADLEKYTSDHYKTDFIACTADQKTEILTHFEAKSRYAINILNKINNKVLGKPFFVKLKELTVEGYCTSQAGATRGLAYDYIPQTYQACIPLTTNQKSWATK